MTIRVLSEPYVPFRANVAADAAAAALVTYPATLCRVVALSVGSVPVTFYDNKLGDTSGGKIGALPAVTAIGQSFDFQMPAFTGISATGGAGCPEYVLSYVPPGTN